MQREEQFLCLSMYTYRDLLKQGDLVVEFLNRVLALVKPFIHDLRVQPGYPGGTQGHISSLNQRTQRRVWDQLLAGKLERLHITQQDWENSFLIPPQINLELELAQHLAYRSYQRLRYPMLPQEYNDQSTAKSLSLAINRDLFNPQSYYHLFDSLVDLGLWTIEALDAVYGFVSLGSFGREFIDLTPYEERHALTYLEYDRALRDKCRGVFHVNFLTTGHITALGNIASLTSLPVVTRAESMKIGNRDVLILSVGEAQVPLNNAQMQAVEELLKPILPQRPAQILVDLINPEVAQEIEGAISQLEALLSPSRLAVMPNGTVLVFRKTEEDNADQPDYAEVSRHLFAIYQEHMSGFPWHGPVFGTVYPGWCLFRIGRHGNHLNRMPFIQCSSLIDVKPFEMTLWLGSPPGKRIKQALVDLFSAWAGFHYPGYTDEELAIDLLDLRFQEREVTMQAEIRAHRGFVLATLISMLDLFSLKQARIEEVVLGQIEDLDSLLAKAGR